MMEYGNVILVLTSDEVKLIAACLKTHPRATETDMANLIYYIEKKVEKNA